MQDSIILLLSCPDQKGVVAEVAAFIQKQSGNIYNADQYHDADEGQFFARFAWHQQGKYPLTELEETFAPLAQRFSMGWHMHSGKGNLRSAIFVSQYDHCLYDLLVHQKELATDFLCVIGNHERLRSVAEHFDLPFYFIDPKTLGKKEAEAQQLEILRKERIELGILARYMQILSPEFLEAAACPIINIHHSFLPAFKGAKPYHQAYQRGVKIIGATSHYVTPDLDQGPIIAQGVLPVSHRDGIQDLVRKGRSLEKQVLLQAVQAHCEHRVYIFQNKTMVFHA